MAGIQLILLFSSVNNCLFQYVSGEKRLRYHTRLCYLELLRNKTLVNKFVLIYEVLYHNFSALDQCSKKLHYRDMLENI